MANTYFQFQKFRINQEASGMKVTTDACLFGAWIASQIQQESQEPERILDIGAGTGLLTLMLAQETLNTKIEAVEINDKAYLEANNNIQSSPWNERIESHFTSIQQYNPNEQFDVVICNPPFFHNSQKGVQNDKNQALHSDHLSQEDLLKQVKRLLTNKGRFYLLYPEKEMLDFITSAKIVGLSPMKKIIVRNQAGQSIFRMMSCFQYSNSKLKEEELIIRMKSDKYTGDFWELLKDYYLEYNDPKVKKA